MSGAEPDLRGLQALPLFLGLRSTIRAMVTAERAVQETAEAQIRDRNEAGRYLDAATAYLAPPVPQLVAVGGLSGTGKSTLASGLAPQIGPAPGAVHLRSDLERKSLFGVGETTRLGPEAYTPAAGEKVYAVLYSKMRHVLAAGHAGIVDAVFARPEERTEIERGQVLCKPGSMNPHTKVRAEVYVLSKVEGGRHTPFFNGYRPQFYIRTTDVTGSIALPEGVEMVMPGDNITLKGELITPVAMDEGLRFAIREGGRTVGAGVVTKILN